MQSRTHLIHIPLLVAFVGLLSALWTGLLRIGWHLPSPHAGFELAHGPLMVCGFLGTFIIVERAVALSAVLSVRVRYLPYGGALLTAIGVILLLLGFEESPAPLFIWAGSLGLVLIFTYIVEKHPAQYTRVMALGALAWLLGNLVWLMDAPFYEIVPWWMGFLVLTIAGERLELARMVNLPGRVRFLFSAGVAVLLLGIAMTQLNLNLGTRIMGIGQVTIALWLLRFDIARRTIRQDGLPRFVAACLLAGYVWLLLSGVIAISAGGVMAGPRYDALLHTLFLGFAFSMIFGHAPIILPAILNIFLNYQPAFYSHLVALHVSLGLRVFGDLAPWYPTRRWGGLLNAAVILLFLVNTVRAVLQSRQSPLPIRKSKAAILTMLVPLPAFMIGLALIVVGFAADPTPPPTQTPVASFPAGGEPAPTSTPAATADPSIVVLGESAFMTYCSACHGPDAHGLPGLGKTLAESEFIARTSDTELHDFIVAGRPVWDPENTTGIAMPPRGGNPALSDRDIDRIIAYLRTLQSP